MVCLFSLEINLNVLFTQFYVCVVFILQRWVRNMRQRRIGNNVRFEVFTAVTVKNGVFWVVTSCDSCKNRRFGGAYRLHRQGFPVCFSYQLPSSLILSILMKGAIHASETSAHTRATRRNIQEDTILHSHRRGNLKSYIALTGWPL
jgi:hypothetical protein